MLSHTLLDRGTHLQLAAVELDQAAIRKEQLPASNCGGQRFAAPAEHALHVHSFGGSLQSSGLIRVAAPHLWPGCAGLHKQQRTCSESNSACIVHQWADQLCPPVGNLFAEYALNIWDDVSQQMLCMFCKRLQRLTRAMRHTLDPSQPMGQLAILRTQHAM